jgi:hypothetical protein
VIASDPTEFFTGKRMARQDGPLQSKSVYRLQHILAQASGRIVIYCRLRLAGISKSSSRYGVDVIRFYKFGRETIKYVRRIAKPCQEDQRPPGAAPIQDFEFYAILNIYKADLVRGLISNGRAECFRARCGN